MNISQRHLNKVAMKREIIAHDWIRTSAEVTALPTVQQLVHRVLLRLKLAQS